MKLQCLWARKSPSVVSPLSAVSMWSARTVPVVVVFILISACVVFCALYDGCLSCARVIYSWPGGACAHGLAHGRGWPAG